MSIPPCVVIPTLLNVHIQASPEELGVALERSREAYLSIRSMPAPRRGEIIRQIREALSAKVCFASYGSRLLFTASTA